MCRRPSHHITRIRFRSDGAHLHTHGKSSQVNVIEFSDLFITAAVCVCPLNNGNYDCAIIVNNNNTIDSTNIRCPMSIVHAQTLTFSLPLSLSLTHTFVVVVDVVGVAIWFRILISFVQHVQPGRRLLLRFPLDQLLPSAHASSTWRLSKFTCIKCAAKRASHKV